MRPRPPDGVPRPRQIHIGLSEAEAQLLAGAAYADGKKVTWWVMEVALAAARARTDDELGDAVAAAVNVVSRAIPRDNPADWSRLRAAALPAVLAEILRRPRAAS